MNPPDAEIRARFDDRRAEDAGEIPEFSAMWSDVERRANATVARRPIRALWWGVAAAAAVLVAAMIVRRPDRATASVAAAVADSASYPSILLWTSPTGGLLRASQPTSMAPSVFGSVLDGVTTPQAQSDSSRRGGL